MKFKYPAKIVRPAPKKRSVEQKTPENSRPTERGRIPRHNSARDVLAVRVTSRRGDESVGTGVFAFASRDPSRVLAHVPEGRREKGGAGIVPPDPRSLGFAAVGETRGDDARTSRGSRARIERWTST